MNLSPSTTYTSQQLARTYGVATVDAKKTLPRRGDAIQATTHRAVTSAYTTNRVGTFDYPQLGAHYLQAEDPDVKRLLASGVVDAYQLMDARAALRRFFGDAVARLSVRQDEHGEDTLWIYIILPRDDQTGLGKLDRFDDEWLLKQPRQFADRVAFNLAYA